MPSIGVVPVGTSTDSGPELRLGEPPVEESSAPSARDVRPVFVFGAPYSGANVLGWSLAQHPAFEPVVERAAAEEVVNALHGIAADLVPRLSSELSSILGAVVREDSQPTEASHADVLDVVRRYVRDRTRSRVGARRPILVAAEYASHSYLLSELFPHARFIHVVRDVESVVRAAAQTEAFAQADVVESWSQNVEAATNVERALGSRRVMRLSYAALLTAPRQELRRCLDFLGEEALTDDCSWPLTVLGPPMELFLDQASEPDPIPAAVRGLSRRLVEERPCYVADPRELRRLRKAAVPSATDNPRLAGTPFHRLVAAVVAETERILVVSRGDEQLLRLGNRDAQHFPQTVDGRYAGFHPAATEDVLEHLAELRSTGARYLVFPPPSYWWFEYYVGLEDHLHEIGRELISGEHCRIFLLEPDVSVSPQNLPRDHGAVRDPDNDQAFAIAVGMQPRRTGRERLSGELWAISTFFNPAQYENKSRNYRRFRDAVEQAGLPLLTIEVAFGDDEFELGSGDAHRLVQLRAADVLWQKERMVNVGLRYLPDDCDKVAWLDGDVVLTSKRWVDETAKLLRDHVVVQPFSHCVRLARDQRYCDAAALPFGVDEGKLFYGVAFGVFANGRRALASYSVAGHTGYAWAARRAFLERHGLYDKNLFANGDMDFAQALWGNTDYFALNARSAKAREDVRRWASGVTAAVGGSTAFADGLLLHFWHGAHKDRSYDRALDVMERFEPQRDLRVDSKTGLYRWGEADARLQRWARTYFSDRREE